MRQSRFLLPLLLVAACSSEQPHVAAVRDTVMKQAVIAADTSSPEGITFRVADVKPADKPLEVNGMEYVLESRIGKKVFTFPEEQAQQELVPTAMNGFVEAVQYSYAEHRPLVLSPDAVWLLLCQGLSIHLNEHFDSLRPLLFTSEKPVDLHVRNDSLAGRKSEQWKLLLTDFSKQAKQYTKSDVYGTVVQQFSTTTSIERTAYEITLLEMQQKAFNYIAESGCGIPEVTLRGKISDWVRIDSCIEGFRRFGLEQWVDNLHPVLRQFIEARKGKADRKFWNAMYKEASMYGAFYISGWIVKFFPYIKETVPAGEMETFRYRPNPYLDRDDYHLSTLSTGNFPGGYAKINVQWNDHLAQPEVTKPMLVYAGFFGMRQYGNQALEPVISWAVCEKNAPVVEREIYRQGAAGLTHTPDRWWPEMDEKPEQPPVYGSCKNFPESAALLKQLLQDSLAVQNRSSAFTAHKAAVSFVVTWTGTVTQVRVHPETADAHLQQEVEKLLTTLPQEWKPAIRMMEYDDSDGKKEATRVNYLVNLQLEF